MVRRKVIVWKWNGTQLTDRHIDFRLLRVCVSMVLSFFLFRCVPTWVYWLSLKEKKKKTTKTLRLRLYLRRFERLFVWLFNDGTHMLRIFLHFSKGMRAFPPLPWTVILICRPRVIQSCSYMYSPCASKIFPCLRWRQAREDCVIGKEHLNVKNSRRRKRKEQKKKREANGRQLDPFGLLGYTKTHIFQLFHLASPNNGGCRRS